MQNVDDGIVVISKMTRFFTMKTSLIIPVHSFVDLITNSSSETFVNASES